MTGSQIAVSRATVSVPTDFLGNHFGAYSPVAGQFARWRSHDNGVCWWQINTANGVYDWSVLDARVAALGGAPWTFTCWGTPNWASARPSEPNSYYPGAAAEPSSMTYLSTFVTALCTRYASQGLQCFEVWNEPDNTGFYTGSVATFVSMCSAIYSAAKAVSAGIKVIGPSTCNYYGANGLGSSTWLPSFISAGGFSYIDDVSMHCYQMQWESFENNPVLGFADNLNYYATAASNAGASIMSKSLRCTEFGLLGDGYRLTDDQYIKGFKRGMTVLAAMGFKEADWYAYDAANMGYVGRPAILSAVAAFKPLICGSTISNCVINADDLSVSATINGAQYTF